MSKIYLGRVKDKISAKNSNGMMKEDEFLMISGSNLYLDKHTWDCGWYWGFGYIGNANLHCHADIFLKKLLWLDVSEVFVMFDKGTGALFRDEDFWVFKDLLTQAYALRKAAEVYRHGGHCTTRRGHTDCIKSNVMAGRINLDLKTVLDELWDFLLQCQEDRKEFNKQKSAESAAL